MIFWAGLVGAVVGAAAGTYQKRRRPERAPLVAGLTAAAVFILITAGGALLG